MNNPLLPACCFALINLLSACDNADTSGLNPGFEPVDIDRIIDPVIQTILVQREFDHAGQVERLSFYGQRLLLNGLWLAGLNYATDFQWALPTGSAH